VLLPVASALVVSCSSKHSGSGSVMPTVASNGPAANDTKCCAIPQMQTLGVTTCYAVSDTAMADPNFVSSHGLCTVAGTCFYGCPPSTATGSPGTGAP
jgi:hypothetical protein